MRLLRPPVFFDSHDTRNAYWLTSFLAFYTAVLVTLLVASFFLELSLYHRICIWLSTSLLLSSNFIIWVRMKRGKLQGAGLISVLSLTLMTTVALAMIGTINHSTTSSYFLSIAIASLFLKKRQVISVVLFAAAMLLILFYAEHQLWLPKTLDIYPASSFDLLVWLSTLVLIAVPLYLAISTSRKDTLEAERTAEALATSIRQLQLSQSQLQRLSNKLELRVERRTRELAQSNAELTYQIHERQQAEERYRLVAETATDVILTIDQSNIILSANRAVEKVFGYTTEDVVGQPLTMLVPEHLNVNHLPGLQRFIESRHGHDAWRTRSTRGRHVDGHDVPLEISFGEFILNGEFVFTAFLRDVSERIRAEMMLRETQKTESLGLLAGGVAHDFNNLLAAMLAQASLAMTKMAESEPARSNVEKVMGAARRAADLTRQLLAYSGRGQFEFRSINLNELIGENLHLFNIAIPKRVELQHSFMADLPPIEADSGQMQQVIMNLLLNAVEAIGEDHGYIHITTDVIEIAQENAATANGEGATHLDKTMIDGELHAVKRVNWSALVPGRYVRLSVRDSGCGMSQRTLEEIFTPFFSQKSTGRGLGLAAVHGIVRGHNSALSVSSAAGKGTEFALFFPPLTQEATQPVPHDEPEVKQSEPRDQPLMGKCVLVIDDEEPIREALHDILLLEGVRVICAASGNEGVECFAEAPNEIGLVILDLSMPGMSGTETFYELRKIEPNVRVLLSSGFSEHEASRRFAAQEEIEFIQKPYDAQMLLSKVAQQIQERV